MALDPGAVGAVQAVAGVTSLGFLKVGLENRDTVGGRGFSLFAFAVALWAFGLVVGNVSGGFTVSMWAYNVALLGIELATVGWLLLAVEVTDWVGLTRQLAGGLGAWVVVMQVLLWTNPAGLMFGPATTMDGIVLAPEYAAGFWVLVGGAYLLVTVGVLLLLAEAVTSTGLKRRQSSLLAVATLPTVIANLLSLSNTLVTRFDVSLFGYLLTAFVFAVVLFRGEFLDIVPVARRTAMGELNDAVVTLDEDDRVIDCNSAASRLFGADDCVGTPAEAFFGSAWTELRSRVTDIGDDETEVALTIDGEPRHFSLSVSAVGNDLRGGRVVLFHDITAQKQRERDLERKNEFLDEFATVVSHDVATPLGVVENKARLIELTGDTSHAEDIFDATTQLQELLEELRQLARQGERVGETSTVDLETVTREAWHSVVTPEATLSVDSSCRLEADRDRLRQLLENLLGNAVEHGSTSPGSDTRQDAVEHGSLERDDESGSVDGARETAVQSVADRSGEATTGDSGADGSAPGDGVAVRVGARPAGFYVADDGPGIAPGERENVFDRGYSSADSTGLGLAIVRRIADGHGWTVEVSESREGGARFDVRNVAVDPESATQR